MRARNEAPARTAAWGSPSINVVRLRGALAGSGRGLSFGAQDSHVQPVANRSPVIAASAAGRDPPRSFRIDPIGSVSLVDSSVDSAIGSPVASPVDAKRASWVRLGRRSWQR